VPLPVTVENQLKEGDAILAIEGQPTPDYAALFTVIDELPVTPTVVYSIRREDAEMEVKGPWPFPVYISMVHPNSAGMDAGLKAGYSILSVDGRDMVAFSDLRDVVDTSDGRELHLEVWRDGETLPISLSPRRTDLPKAGGGFETRWLIGLNGGFVFDKAVTSLGLWDSVYNGVRDVDGIIRQSLSALYNVAVGTISECNIRGAIGIAELARDMASQGLYAFIRFIAMLSVAVGLINLFPVPVLDGGHLVFHAYEAVFRRPPSQRALGILMTAGLTIIIAFMSFALINDFRCP
jgi:regulator of sigma E protease